MSTTLPPQNLYSLPTPPPSLSCDKKSEGSKSMAITIFVIIGILLIVYVIYLFEAYKNKWFPFVEYNPTVADIPSGSVFALGDVINEPIVDDANQQELEDTVDAILQSNVNWYKGDNTAAIPLQGTVLGS